MASKKVAFFTLGCKVNQEESFSLEELFRRNGYQVVDFNEPADVYIVNTCTVTHIADRKSRQMLRRAAGRNPQAVIVALGCYAQVAPEELEAIPGVEIIIGTQEKGKVFRLVEEILQKRLKGLPTKKINVVQPFPEQFAFEELPLPRTGRSRAYLKIEDGCDQYCSYCIIPFARGAVRSLAPGVARARFEELLAAGYKEIVLTGVHASAYGRDLPGHENLSYLLKMLLDVPGDFRIRLSSLEPADVTPVLLETVASSPRVCRHLHLPLQSGADEILKLMRRPYTTRDYRRLFEQAITMVPGLAITSDVMVGFPGETPALFEETFNFLASLPFCGLHIFKYSPRKGTAAATFPGQVAAEEKNERSRRLHDLAAKKKVVFAENFIGAVLPVLVEKEIEANSWEGLSDNYLRLYFSGKGDLEGKFLSIRVQAYENGKLYGIVKD